GHVLVSLGALTGHPRANAPGRPDRPTARARSACAALELATLALAETAPDAEALVILQRVLEAFAPDVARRADALGIPRGAALLGEERLRIGLRAQCVGLPGERVVIFRVDVAAYSRNPQLNRIDEPVVGNAGTVMRNRHVVLTPRESCSTLVRVPIITLV